MTRKEIGKKDAGDQQQGKGGDSAGGAKGLVFATLASTLANDCWEITLRGGVELMQKLLWGRKQL